MITSVIGQGLIGSHVTQILSEGGCHVVVHDDTGWASKGGATSSSFSVTDHIRMCNEVGIDFIFLCLPMRNREEKFASDRDYETILEEISLVPNARHRERIVTIVNPVIFPKAASWDMKFAVLGTRVAYCINLDAEKSVLIGQASVLARIKGFFMSAIPSLTVDCDPFRPQFAMKPESREAVNDEMTA